MNDLYIIKAFINNKDIYNKYNTIIYNNINNTYIPEISKLFLVIKLLYDNNDFNSVSINDLEVTLYTEYPFIPEKEQTTFSVLFTRLKEIEVKDDLLDSYLKAYSQNRLANDLSIKLLDFMQGRVQFGTLQEIFGKFSENVQQSNLEAVLEPEPGLEELLQEVVYSDGVKWRQGALNKSLGPLRKGDLGFVFARPETGKTTFLADFSTFVVAQILESENILWFNNEEQDGKVRLRCIQAYFGVTLSELISRKQYYGQRYRDEVMGRIRVINAHGSNVQAIEGYCLKYSPKLIIFDQLDKIQWTDNDREDLRLGEIYKWARGISRLYAPVIGTCQADGSGENVMYLTMANVANAKTSKQAEADWILGIGVRNDIGNDSLRYFNISKNKLVGSTETQPEHRHGRFTLRLNAECARYEEMH